MSDVSLLQSQLGQVGKALVRLLRAPREVQYVVLLNVATMCETQPVMDGTFAISKVSGQMMDEGNCMNTTPPPS